jgi:hypothetical protein
MSSGKKIECQPAIQRFKEEICNLTEQQTEAEKRASLVGMTTEESRQTKNGTVGFRKLTNQLAGLMVSSSAVPGGLL